MPIPPKPTHKDEPAVIMAIIALGALAAICGVMLIPPMWAAVVDLWQYRPPTQQCRMLRDVTARHACFEHLNMQTLYRTPQIIMPFL